MSDYLPKDATIEQACAWLHARTGQTWILPRLLECHLTPHFWLDYKPGYPAIYSDRIEGYQTRIMFQGDLCRLESDGGDALVNMFTAHDGSLIKVEPGLRVPLSELRFKRDQVERVAEIINKTAPAQSTATPAPVGAVGTLGGVVDWKNIVRAEAWEQWVKTLAENGTPTLENVAGHLAYWCATNEINGNFGKPPKAGYLKTHVIDSQHWAPPRGMSREAAKKHLEQKKQKEQAN